jgi:MinD superfamily P-loop ATPase
MAVVINRCDINPDVSRAIKDWVARSGAKLAGTVPYDDSVTAAQMRGLSVVEHSEGPAATSIMDLWEWTARALGI